MVKNDAEHIMNINDQELQDLKNLLKTLINPQGIPCIYCGTPSIDKEHVVPISWINELKELKFMGIDVDVPEEIIVPSCHECNLFASGTIFKSIKEKKRYIKEKLYKRYKKFLNSPEWTEQEIMELDGRLRQHVFITNEIIKIVRKRLKY